MTCPRIVLRGAAAAPNGSLNSRYAVGPSEGKTRGTPVTRAAAVITAIEISPLTSA